MRLVLALSILSTTGHSFLLHHSTPTLQSNLPTPPTILFTTSSDSSTPTDQQQQLSKIKKWRRSDLSGQSLISQTLTDLQSDTIFQETSHLLSTIGPRQMSIDERIKRRRALDELGVPSFLSTATNDKHHPRRKDPSILQINIGLYCNQACSHCHVESSPLRKETMSPSTAAKCLFLLKNTPSITTLDITGGAPELNDQFRLLVSSARSLRPDLVIIDRCNLTVLHEPGQDDLVDFLAENDVRVVASLPCYSADNVDKQRGNGVFERSVSALLMLNERGYGKETEEEGGLVLDLVYNPGGAFLPPDEKMLEMRYKEELLENFGIVFNNLFTITNMPIKRFADFLYRKGELKEYMDLLVQNFNKKTLGSLMCLDTVSVGWDGKVYDCDFNQQLGYAIGSNEAYEGGKSVFDLTSLSELRDDNIYFDNHCFGCTAGQGSS